MILTLFIIIVFIALVMIILGLTRPHESAQALIGFTFLFIMAIIIINGTLEYEIGSSVASNYSYDSSGQVTATSQSITYQYSNFDDDTSHKIGYWLAIASAIGFIGVILSLRRTTDYGS